MSGSEPRHFLQPCLLLLLAEHPDHGYDLAERLRRLGIEETDSAIVYRTLRALERAGWVGSAWTPSQSGPARRTYHLTADGYAALDAGANEYRSVRAVLDGFLHRYDTLRASAAKPGPLHPSRVNGNGAKRWTPAGR
ncbi:MAG: PadR family transcriptional regulator, regulatory protein PadR [Frankiales bacterium]|jgi:poly-beta-hydroxybutyrate-responsive repressor|nr:PadR family transcriptional regulator, regulatory protein PadR [Frankiales bacterium]